MKSALLISGYLRCFKENVDNINKNIIDENNVDIYIHLTMDKEKKYTNKEIKLDEVYKSLNPKCMIVTKNIHFSDDDNINNILNQNYKLFLLNNKRKEIEVLEKIKYNNIIKIRPDVCIQKKIDLNVMYNKIIVPKDAKIDVSKLKNQNDKFICDIIAYGNADSMDKYLNYFEELQELIQKYGIVNETLLYHYLNNKAIIYEEVDIDYQIILSLCNTIAITGDSGTGKTTLSNIIKQIFNESFILECDRYHKWERNDENWNQLTHLNPQSNYITKMQQDVFDLIIGNNIYQVDYDHKTGRFTDRKLIESKENIIVCGLHSLYIEENIINLKIYIDTDDNVRIPWKINRDIKKRGYSIEKIMEQINNRKDDFNKYILPQKSKADIIINFYTDKVFTINNFIPYEKIDVFLRIGISDIFNINNIITSLNVSKIVHENKYIYLYFDYDYDYETIIKNIIINIK
uniref:phosphoribulokinase n=1 Tax=viral metagenome TaxID=1070528 RepID=A0A6C0DIS8_9ZZZZ